MKLIVAIIRPECLEVVQAALQEAGAALLSVSQVVGDGREPGFTEIYRGREVRVRRPKLRLEVAADETLVPRAVDAIARAAATGDPGGVGNVFVMHLDECVGIPAGTSGSGALGR